MNANLPCLVAEPDSGNGEVWLVYHWVACRGSTQAMFIQPLVTLPAALISLSQALRHLVISGTIGLKRGGFCHLNIPMPGPDAVGFSQKICLLFGIGPVRSATTLRQSISPAAMTSSAPGCFLPVARR